MATKRRNDLQTLNVKAARWGVTYQVAFARQMALVSEMHANYNGKGPAPQIDAMDKVTAVWEEADQHRDDLEKFIRSRLG